MAGFLNVFGFFDTGLPAQTLLNVFVLEDETTLTFGLCVRLPLPVWSALGLVKRFFGAGFGVADLKVLRRTNVDVFSWRKPPEPVWDVRAIFLGFNIQPSDEHKSVLINQ